MGTSGLESRRHVRAWGFDSSTFCMQQIEYEGYEKDNVAYALASREPVTIPEGTLIKDVYGPSTFYLAGSELNFFFEGFDDDTD